jgi:hypothetical protein
VTSPFNLHSLLRNYLKLFGEDSCVIKKSRRGVWGPLKVSSGSRAEPWLGGPGGKPRKLLGFAYLGSFSSSILKHFVNVMKCVTPSFQIIFKLTQSFFQRFVGGANSPDSKSLTVWYALSHMRRMTAAREKVLIKTTARIVYWKTAFLVQIYRWCGYEVDSEWWRITELSFTCQ